MSDEQRPKVGVGVVIKKDNSILLGKRRNAHGDGEYSCPGGHLEYGESIVECAKRETLEETGVVIDNVQLLCVSNEKRYLPKHYVNIGVVADWKSGEPSVTEKDKFVEVGWYDLNDLPKPHFEMLENYLTALKTGRNFFDY